MYLSVIQKGKELVFLIDVSNDTLQKIAGCYFGQPFLSPKNERFLIMGVAPDPFYPKEGKAPKSAHTVCRFSRGKDLGGTEGWINATCLI